MTVQMTQGAFVNTASTPYFVPLSQYVSKFVLRNLTRSGMTSQGVAGSLTSDRIVEAIWTPYYAQGTALITQQGTVSGILAPKNNGIAAINGFTVFNAANQQNGPNIVVNSFTPGATTVWVTNSAHGFQVGDNVRVGSLTSAPEFGGLVMTVTAVGSTTQFTTLLVSTGHTTSVGVVYKVGNAYLPPRSLYYPEVLRVASVTLANPMVVTLLTRQVYHVGDVVRFAFPTAYGMSQLNSGTNGLPLEFTISAVNNAVGTQTVTFANVSSTAYTAFAYALAASYPYGPAVMIPQGEGNTNNLFGVTPTPFAYGNQNVLSFARQNLGQNGILIGAGDGTNSATTGGLIGSTTDAWEWECYSAQQMYPQP